MELWIRSGKHRVSISDADMHASPDVLDMWLSAASRTLIAIDYALRTVADPHDAPADQ